ncbi:uncharacterized protein LOC127788118 [Diospyros lotus]|uniref:uncharacterized protein LOC127788118 n=1 Tax=Diospyros lotus TaxID=55363 RepID=UPI0022528003|nr:uncharacterized protein LOC127788118 [Diospyros lotus]
MAGEDIPRGISMEQAQIMNLQQRQEEIMEQLARLTQAFERIGVQQQPQASRRAVHNDEGEENATGNDDSEVEQPWQRRQQRDSGNNIKMRIPPFKGTSSPEEYLEWVQRVEKVFEYQEYSEVRKCQLAALEFTDYANLWWENLKAQRRRDGEEDVRSWGVMKRLMKKRFVPEYYKQELYIRLQSLRQGGMSVEDYVKEFEMLMMRCELQELQEQTIARFIGGLNREIANIVELQPFVFLEDIIKLAIKVERQLKRNPTKHMVSRQTGSKITNSLSTSTRGSFADWGTNQKEKGDSSKPPARMGKEKEKVGNPNPPQRSRDIKCFKCLGHGHITSECPNKRVMVLRGTQEEVESEDEAALEEEDECMDEESLHADDGELLMIRRSLNLQAKLDDEQRENIFHTRCTINEKLCGVIIDGGSCANVASTTMVEKLNLATTRHPHPYKLQWLNNNGEIRVTKQVVVPFSIGKTYKEELLCDVIPMNATHLLLGRPWQYDRRVIHDGFKNTYSFVKDGKSISLVPLSPQQVQQDQLLMERGKKESLLVGKKEVERALSIHNLVLVLIVKEATSDKEPPYQIDQHIEPTQKKPRSCIGK